MRIGIMCTGGMDSTTLLYKCAIEKHEVFPITVNYEHTAFPKQEELLNWHINFLQQKGENVHSLQIIPVKFLPFQRHSEALFDPNYKCNEKNPLEEWDQIRYEKSLVEGRNAIMVLYALGYCISQEIDELWAGYLYGDEEWKKRFTVKLLTGDNSPQFVDTMNILSMMGFSRSVRFRAPFYEMRMNKSAVHKMGKCFGVNFEKTHSCYFPIPCHICDNCLLRDQILGV